MFPVEISGYQNATGSPKKPAETEKEVGKHFSDFSTRTHQEQQLEFKDRWNLAIWCIPNFGRFFLQDKGEPLEDIEEIFKLMYNTRCLNKRETDFPKSF